MSPLMVEQKVGSSRGGDGVDFGQGHDLLVEERCVDDVVDLVVPLER